MEEKIQNCYEMIKNHYENRNDIIFSDLYRSQALVYAREIAKESGIGEEHAYDIFFIVDAAVHMKKSLSELERIFKEYGIL